MRKTTAIVFILLCAFVLFACGDVAETSIDTVTDTVTEILYTTACPPEITDVFTQTVECTTFATEEITVTEDTELTVTKAVTTAYPRVTESAPPNVTEPYPTTYETVETEPPVTTTEQTTEHATEQPPAVTEPFDYATANLDEYLLLGKYMGIEVLAPETVPVFDYEVEAVISDYIATLPLEAMVYNRACEYGDKINVDFFGRVDGVEFNRGYTDVSFVLGDGEYSDGFESGIVGMLPGDVFTVFVKMPEDSYGEIAGKSVEFDVILNYIYPTLTDEIATEYFGKESATAFFEEIREELDYFANGETDEDRIFAVWTKILANSRVIYYPEAPLASAYQVQVNMYKEEAAACGMSYEEYFYDMYGISVKEGESIIRESSKNIVKQQLVLYAIAKRMGMELSESAFEKKLWEYAVDYGATSFDELVRVSGRSLAYLRGRIIYETIIPEIVKNAVFIEIGR